MIETKPMGDREGDIHTHPHTHKDPSMSSDLCSTEEMLIEFDRYEIVRFRNEVLQAMGREKHWYPTTREEETLLIGVMKNLIRSQDALRQSIVYRMMMDPAYRMNILSCSEGSREKA